MNDSEWRRLRRVRARDEHADWLIVVLGIFVLPGVAWALGSIQVAAVILVVSFFWAASRAR